MPTCCCLLQQGSVVDWRQRRQAGRAEIAADQCRPAAVTTRALLLLCFVCSHMHACHCTSHSSPTVRAHPALVAEHWLVIESACRSWSRDSILAALWAAPIGVATVPILPPCSTDADAAAAGDGFGRGLKVTVRCGSSSRFCSGAGPSARWCEPWGDSGILLLRCRRRFLADARTATTFVSAGVTPSALALLEHCDALMAIAGQQLSSTRVRNCYLQSMYLVVHMGQRVSGAAIRQLVLAPGGVFC